MVKLLKIIRFLLISLILMVVLMTIAGYAVYYHFSKDLPKLDSLNDYSPLIASEVFASDGTKIGEFWSEKRIMLGVKEMPVTVVQAIISAEDTRFFEHKGIDYKGIIRAFIKNLMAGHTVEGGSTITQQLIKSLVLSKEKKYSRKIKEAILAVRLEKNFGNNKEAILNIYLNHINFGNHSYGIEAAAQNYFHKKAKELNFAEAALLVSLAKFPNKLSVDYQTVKNRQLYVLQSMYDEGYIKSKEQLEKSKNEVLTFYRAPATDRIFNLRYAPWFTEYIRTYLQEKYGETTPYTQGYRIETTIDLSMQKAADNAVDKGLRELDQRLGYVGPIKVLDKNEIQAFADEVHLSIIKNKMELDEVFLMPKDAELLTKPTPLEKNRYYTAIITGIGSKNELQVQVGHATGIINPQDYSWAKRGINHRRITKDNLKLVTGRKQVFAVGDVVQVKVLSDTGKSTDLNFHLEQEPGVESALFSYEPSTGFVRAMVGGRDFTKSEFNRAMIAKRQTGSTIKPLIYAAAIDKGYNLDTPIDDSPVYFPMGNGKFWSPKNYGGNFSGMTNFRNALVNSRNVPTVKILVDIGTHFSAAFCRKLGITTPIDRVYAMALGANDMKLFEMARAYGTFDNGGILPDLIFIRTMTNTKGQIIEEYKPKKVIPYAEQMEKIKKLANKDPNAVEYRDDLWEIGQKWIESDKLELSDAEKKILYGNYIPEGYTISPRTAYMMMQLMTDIVNFGTGYKVKELGRPAAGKTGTTNDETDVWFIGFVPDLVAGVWVGYDEVQKIGPGETGGKAAAPIFLYYMKEVLKDKPVAQFKIPDDINQAALKAPIDASAGDAEEVGVDMGTTPSSSDFIIQDF